MKAARPSGGAVFAFGAGDHESVTATQPFLPMFATTWVEVRDGNDSARGLFHRHYSRHNYRDGRKPLLFCGPGEKMVLLSPCARALFVWRKFISADKRFGAGVNCSIFRNESDRLASELILAAEVLAWRRWPGERLYTYVDSRKVQSSNPGYCFKRAGWSLCGRTKDRGLLVFEKNAIAPPLARE